MSRAFMFTTSLPPPVSASLLKSLEVIETEPKWAQPALEQHTPPEKRAFVAWFRYGQFGILDNTVIIGDDMKTGMMTGMLQDEGVFVSPVLYPAVRRRESASG